MKEERISPRVIERLTKYLRCMETLNPGDYISSGELSEKMGFTAAQVRKDLSNFGEFGIRGKGYHVRMLTNSIQKVLGIHKKNTIIVVGIGRLGMALISEPDFTKENFEIVGLFDKSEEKIGKIINGIQIRDIEEITDFIKYEERIVDTAILTVPKFAAQEVADLLVKSGVKSILNFAPKKLELPQDFVIENIDLFAKLQEVTYWKEQIYFKK